MATNRGKLYTLLVPAAVALWALMSCTLPQVSTIPAGGGAQKATADVQTAIAVIQTVTAEAQFAAPPIVLPSPALLIETVPPIATWPALGCVDNAAFVGDVTVPDNSAFSLGDHFDKTWRVSNSGSCTWGAGYQLVFVSGNIMGAQNSVGVALTDPGAQSDVTVAMTAPGNPGSYSGIWQMMNASGQRFGPKYTIVIQVLAPQAPAATFTAPPPPPVATDTPTNVPPAPQPSNVQITSDETSLKAGECTYVRAYAEGVSAAWLDGEGVVGGYKVKKVCPCTTTTYELKADLQNGEHRTRTVKVSVTGSCIQSLATLLKPRSSIQAVTVAPRILVTVKP